MEKVRKRGRGGIGYSIVLVPHNNVFGFGFGFGFFLFMLEMLMLMHAEESVMGMVSFV